MPISGRTRVCGIIGDPIEHTMSPAMHNAAFSGLGLDYVFVPFHVKAGTLRAAIEGVRGLGIRGLGVTIPHKVAVMPHLDEIDSLAQKIGAVNIIVNDDGLLRGYNTDAGGFLKALQNRGVEPRGKQAAILGAGGAARAVAFILAQHGAKLVILNRTAQKAHELAGRVSGAFPDSARALQLDGNNLEAALGQADILVNCTSAGMSPHADETLVGAGKLRPGMTVVDAVYNPIRTRLLEEAERAGAAAISGADMLLWQGALAFEMWTGQRAPVDIMRQALLRVLAR